METTGPESERRRPFERIRNWADAAVYAARPALFVCACSASVVGLKLTLGNLLLGIPTLALGLGSLAKLAGMKTQRGPPEH